MPLARVDKRLSAGLFVFVTTVLRRVAVESAQSALFRWRVRATELNYYYGAAYYYFYYYYYYYYYYGSYHTNTK